MELPIAQPAYKSPSQDVANQELVNFFLTPAKQIFESDPKYAIFPVAGKREIVDLGGLETRAVMEINDTVYAVVDSSVYKLTITEGLSVTPTLLGTISTSERGPVYWAANNNSQIMLVDGTATGGYIIDQSDDSFSQITDPDFIGGVTVVFIDGYFIYNPPNAQTMYATASNDGTDISGLDVASAEGANDKLVALASDKRELWAFGKKTIEIWWDEANATGFPFSRRNDAYLDIGCAAAGSVLNFDNSLVWLDNRGFVVRAEGYAARVLSDPAVSAAIASYSRIDDARAFTHVDRGSLFYILTFPTAHKTWAYDAVTQEWHERAYFNNSNQWRHDLVNCQCRYGNYDVIGLRNSGKICIWDATCYTDAGEPIHRLIKTAHYQQDLADLDIRAIELQVETGKNSPTDAEPFVVLRTSNDNGYTWSNEMWESMGSMGDHIKPIIWYRLGTGRRWQFEFRFTAPQAFSIVRAKVDVGVGL